MLDKSFTMQFESRIEIQNKIHPRETEMHSNEGWQLWEQQFAEKSCQEKFEFICGN